jgi:hypothetical protein
MNWPNCFEAPDIAARTISSGGSGSCYIAEVGKRGFEHHLAGVALFHPGVSGFFR